MRSLTRRFKEIKNFWDLLLLGETDIFILDRTSDFIHNIKCKIIVLVESIERFFWWGWKMRMSHDWDSAFLLEVMLLKMKRMERCFEKHGNLMWNQEPDSDEYRYMRALKISIKLLERLTERSSNTYVINAWKDHDKKWGRVITNRDSVETPKLFKLTRENIKTNKDEDEYNKDFKKLMDLDYEIYTRDNRILWKIIEKYHGHWWD